jgi:hypothetical protein
LTNTSNTGSKEFSRVSWGKGNDISCQSDSVDELELRRASPLLNT